MDKMEAVTPRVFRKAIAFYELKMLFSTVHRRGGNFKIFLKKKLTVITFCVSRRRRKMYCGHARLSACVCVCLSVCLSAAVRPHYCTDPDVTWRRGRGCPLVVHYWADLQSGHGLRCYGNNANPSYKLASIPRYDDIVRTAGCAGSARAAGRRPAGDGGVLDITAAVCTAGFHWWRSGTSGNKKAKSKRKMLASTCL